jgi:hypothetical protein
MRSTAQFLQRCVVTVALALGRHTCLTLQQGALLGLVDVLRGRPPHSAHLFLERSADLRNTR